MLTPKHVSTNTYAYKKCLHNLYVYIFSQRGQLSVSIPAKGYSIGQGKKTRYAITLNPDVFFAGTKTCTHRPTYVKWQSSPPPPPPAKQPEKVEQAPLPKVDTPPPAKEIEKLEKELLWTKKKLETLKQEYKTTIQAVYVYRYKSKTYVRMLHIRFLSSSHVRIKVKEKNQMEMKELKENQKIEIKYNYRGLFHNNLYYHYSLDNIYVHMSSDIRTYVCHIYFICIGCWRQHMAC